ncbi:PREDICTED: group XIIA secretory phospholipase A2 [Pygoscelis adeliae]|nr:PREDICTED: group XIIA secretory phospholipase A2 [Pygoscelis adeliae]
MPGENIQGLILQHAVRGSFATALTDPELAKEKGPSTKLERLSRKSFCFHQSSAGSSQGPAEPAPPRHTKWQPAALPVCAWTGLEKVPPRNKGHRDRLEAAALLLLKQPALSRGSKPVPRYGYKPSPPNGCGSPLFGVQFDIGIPLMTKCCNHHDRCYDTCGNKKNDCDEQFQSCLSKICRDVQKTLGISESVQACESTVQLLFDAVIHLGCKPYLDSQRAACMCRYEDKTDL